MESVRQLDAVAPNRIKWCLDRIKLAQPINVQPQQHRDVKGAAAIADRLAHASPLMQADCEFLHRKLLKYVREAHAHS